MDDYNIDSLIESKNEWCIRLIDILTSPIISGLKSIYDEALILCKNNNEENKYLMTFQNLLVNIPKWSQAIVEAETTRITNVSNCNYIDDLISCVHIIQLKSLTACRAGIKQKKIDIQIPDLNSFIHKVYINAARKIYLNIYLFQKDILPLEIQKNNRELELIVKEQILITIRDSIPVENILRAYLDETEETDIVVEEKKETIIDKERVKEEELREQKLEKNKQLLEEKEQLQEKQRNIDKIKDDTEKDLLLNVNNSLDNVKKELPKMLESINDIKNKETDDKHKHEESVNANEKILLKELETNNIDNKVNNNIYKDLDKDKNNDFEENPDIINISDDIIDKDLEILDLSTPIETEDNIKLDIEEL